MFAVSGGNFAFLRRKGAWALLKRANLLRVPEDRSRPKFLFASPRPRKKMTKIGLFCRKNTVSQGPGGRLVGEVPRFAGKLGFYFFQGSQFGCACAR